MPTPNTTIILQDLNDKSNFKIDLMKNLLDKIQNLLNDSLFDPFANWIIQKFVLHSKINRPSFKEQEVWWCSYGQNVGDEENGKGDNFMRPVAIIRKYNKNLALVAPTSTKIKDSPYYHRIEYEGQKYSVLISQMKTIDTKRLQKKIVTLSDNDFQKLIQAIIKTIFKQ
jgi:mRNA interferase MazF